ncbi:hypothetical protein FRB99_001269 [Tulasnella sp. 403]|nr:hypothetical protein FRB99_001269 [Tulasnella sp. 403]
MPELNFSTFDLGDLELKTLPRGGLAVLTQPGPTQSRITLDTRSERTTNQLEWSSLDSTAEGGDLGDTRSRRTSLTMVDLQSDDEVSYIDEEGRGEASARRGKWLSFEQGPTESRSVTPNSTCRRQQHLSVWNLDSTDIRPRSQQGPVIPSLPVPPSSRQAARTTFVGTRVLSSTHLSPNHDRQLDGEQTRDSSIRWLQADPVTPPRQRLRFGNSPATPEIRISIGSDEGEQFPLSPRIQRPPSGVPPGVRRMGRIAPWRV